MSWQPHIIEKANRGETLGLKGARWSIQIIEQNKQSRNIEYKRCVSGGMLKSLIGVQGCVYKSQNRTNTGEILGLKVELQCNKAQNKKQ